MGLLIKIATTLLAPFLFVGASLGTFVAPEQPLGASQEIPTTIAFFETTLASAISDSATSFTLTSAVDKDGTTLASSTYAFVIDEGSSNEEIVLADCTGTACTNVERGISVRTGNTEVATLKKSHRRGASIKITDAPILPLVARILRGEGTVDFTPTVDGNLVTKEYVDNLALGSTTVSATYVDDGIVELSTGLQAASSTPTDDSGSPLVLHTGISTSTGGTAYTVPVTGSDGTLDDDFIPASLTNIYSRFYATTSVGTSTWSVPSGVNGVKVTVCGGGGDGYGGDGNGGGGSGCAIGWIDVSATTSIQIVVGDETQPSKFGTWLVGNGGADATASDPGSGGTATGGDLNIKGQNGHYYINTDIDWGGAGGSSYMGIGGANTKGCGDSAGSCGYTGASGTGYGAGGAGGSQGSSGTGVGGDATEGIVLIEY